MSSTANKSTEFESFNTASFSSLPLSKAVVQAVEENGYSTPTPIQEKIIPILCEGKDVIGQAQTGTGKTAAFALPILSKIRLSHQEEDNIPQALILAPTRELAIQVADSFRKYSSKMRGLSVATICGGQDYRSQLKQLKDGSHIIVGTPGRIIDHINRGTLNITHINTLVLDEADEMLRMGFIDDIDWILSQTPAEKQIALFSATMPGAIRNIADKYLKNPVKINIEPKKETSNLISQYYWGVNYQNKMDALLRFLEIIKCDGIDTMDAMIVFARTKVETMLIGEQLLACGHRAIVLNGDIEQKMRERSIKELKAGKIDILIATDVAARGLDVDRITHVINYDMPHDQETYLHRIGRTGRAGRKGVAITFATGSETSKLRYIERFTNTPIEKFQMPTITEINKKRVDSFKSKVLNVIKSSHNKPNARENFEAMVNVINQISKESAGEFDISSQDVAAAVAIMLHGHSRLLLNESDMLKSVDNNSSRSYSNNSNGDRNSRRGDFNRRDSSRSERSRSSGSRFDDRGRGGNRDRDASTKFGKFVSKDKNSGESKFAGRDRGFAGSDRFVQRDRSDRDRSGSGYKSREKDRDSKPARFSSDRGSSGSSYQSRDRDSKPARFSSDRSSSGSSYQSRDRDSKPARFSSDRSSSGSGYQSRDRDNKSARFSSGRDSSGSGYKSRDRDSKPGFSPDRTLRLKSKKKSNASTARIRD